MRLSNYRQYALSVLTTIATLAGCSNGGSQLTPSAIPQNAVQSRANNSVVQGTNRVAGSALTRGVKYYSVLWSFNRYDGEYPWGGLIADASGALYGTTLGQFQAGGTVFKLTPSGSRYTERVLWSFGKGQDGFEPRAGLIADATGALYGTTFNGGVYGGGIAFKLTPSGSSYTERVLWSFGNGQDGAGPQAGLITKHGALYGTTDSGGAYGLGTAFKLSPSGSGYTERVLWNFGSGRDGVYPNAVIANEGALYGTTINGGANGAGTVFKLTPSGSNYTERVLWSFGNGHDGQEPFYAGVIAKGGAFYGTTSAGGAHGLGTVFKLTPSGSSYTERVLWNFGNMQGDAEFPYAGLITRDGVLYGTTTRGGSVGGGTVFKLTPSGSNYTERVLWSFGKANDGCHPQASLIADATGAFYGTTVYGGGCGGYGIVFKLIP